MILMNTKVSYTILLVSLVFPFVYHFLKTHYIPSVEELERLRRFVTDEISINIPIYVRFGDEGFLFPDLIDATQKQLNYESERIFKGNWHFKLIDELEQSRRDNFKRSKDKAAGKVDSAVPDSSYQQHKNEYVLELVHSSDNSVGVDSEEMKAYVFYSFSAIHSNDLPFFITQTILHHLMLAELEVFKEGIDNRCFNYTSSVHLNFVFIDPLYKETEEEAFKLSTDELLTQYQEKLSDYSNFTFETYIAAPDNIIDLMELNHIFNDTINNFFFSHISNKDVIPARLSENYHISYLENETSTHFNRTDILQFSIPVLQAIEKRFDLPKNPTNNLVIKLATMKRFMTLQGLLDSIDNLEAYIRSRANLGSSPTLAHLNEVIKEMYSIIDNLVVNEDCTDWTTFLLESEMLYHDTKLLLNSYS